MKTLTLVRVHTLSVLRELLRTPAFVVSTVGFPTLVFCLFALGYARTNSAAANFFVASYVGFAMIGVTLFEFGVGIAAERGRPWERYLRSLPVSVGVRFTARIVVALFFGILSAGMVALVARMLAPVTLTGPQWLLVCAYAGLGAVPFVLLGIAIAYWCSPRSALPVTNILYLLGLFAGGFFMPPQFLPPFAAAISPFTPTRAYGELLWSVAAPRAVWGDVALLACYSAAFLVIAAIGYRRDERARYA